SRLRAVHLLLERVQNAHAYAALGQRVGEMRADEAGAARDQHARVSLQVRSVDVMRGAHTALAPASEDTAVDRSPGGAFAMSSSPLSSLSCTSSMVSFNPSSSGVRGRQPSVCTASEMSGRRLGGSSTGSGAMTTRDFEPVR